MFTSTIKSASGYSLLELALCLLLAGCIFLFMSRMWLIIVSDTGRLNQSISELQELENLSLRLDYFAKYARAITLSHQKSGDQKLTFFLDIYHDSHWEYLPVSLYLVNHQWYQKISDSSAQLLIKNIKKLLLEPIYKASDNQDIIGADVDLYGIKYRWKMDLIIN